MSEVLQKYFLQKRRYARDSSQELHLLPQLLGNLDEINLYVKVSGRHIIIYEVILNLGFRLKRNLI